MSQSLRRSGIVALLLGVITALITSVAGTASAATPSNAYKGCTDVAVFASRGSGEGWYDGGNSRVDGFGSTLSAQYNRIKAANPRKSFSAYANPYTAVPVNTLSALVSTSRGGYTGYYGVSVQNGVNAGSTVLTNLANKCPRTKIVMLGYSQGAQVNDGILQRLPWVSGRVAVAVNFGDPTFNPRFGINVGTYRSDRYGVATRFVPPVSGYGSYPANRMLQVCHGGDLICQTVGTTGPHGTYGSETFPTTYVTNALR